MGELSVQDGKWVEIWNSYQSALLQELFEQVVT